METAGENRRDEAGVIRDSTGRSSLPPVSRHVLILGAGFGGLELATRLSETIADAVHVTLIDRNDSFYFGFSKLEVMLGRQSADDIRLHYRDLEKDGVEFRQETVTGVDPAARRVTTDAASYDADFVVVALGADYDFAATPGFEQGGHEYYSLAGAERLRDALADFKGGKVLVSVLGQPFKCPPAPFEGSFLLHEHFTKQGIRDSVEMATTFPMARPVPVTGEVAQMFRDGLATRNVKELPEHLVTGIDPATRTAQLASGETLPYDLFVGIPIHRAPAALADTGLVVNNWVPVDQSNLRTPFPGVYALGDVCTGPRTVPKAGIFAEAAARVVADDIAAAITGAEPPAPYEGSGVCYAEFGDGLVSKVEVNFLRGDAPAAQRNDPSLEYAAEKEEFGAVRRARWFGRS
jgi:sulfide:quinone oxidoreductase